MSRLNLLNPFMDECKMFGIHLLMSGLITTGLCGNLYMDSVTNIVRDPSGDLFSISSDDCFTGGCARNGRFAETVRATTSQCRCQCSDSHPVMRDDKNECVHQLECSLVTFIRPLLTEHIPVVSLPVSSGQLIYPGAHLTLSGIDKSVNHSKQLLCQIDSSFIMTQRGWQLIRMNDGSHVFELYEDGNHTFLQWLGTDSVRKSLRQKLVLIRLICSPAVSSDDNYVFKPCIAIRIGWVPGLGITNKKESSDQNKSTNSQNTNYLMIGLCLALLGIMYISALMIYMRTKNTDQNKYKDRIITHRWPSDSEESQATTNITTTDGSDNSNNEFRNNSPENGSINIDIETDSYRPGIRSPTDWTQVSHFSDQNDSSNNSEDDNLYGSIPFDGRELQSSVDSSHIHHPIYQKRLQKPERIPRHSLRVSPELFEPQMLLNPPQSAIDLLQKIRDLITIAKCRLRSFRFRPTLMVIPEDDYFYNENSNDMFATEIVIQSDNEMILRSEGTSLGTGQHIIEMSGQKSDQTNEMGITLTYQRETDSDSDVTTDQNILLDKTENNDFGPVSDRNGVVTRSVSRRKMLNNLQTHVVTINNLNCDQKQVIPNKSIDVQNLDIETEDIDEQHIYSDIHSLKLMSTKVENSLYKNFEKQILNERQVSESTDKRMFSYFKSSLGRFSSKSKQKSDQVLVSSNNWTLQTVGAVRSSRSRNMATKSVIRKKMITRRGKLCYNCSDVSSLSCNRLTDSYTDSEQKPSLESNENNESIDSFECCAYSDSEMSTTSSTIRDNQLTSLESELNDESNNSQECQTINGEEEEHHSIDECLKYLAAASVDTTAKNRDKYYERIGRASKGMSALKHLKSGDWNHICHRSDSELEVSEKSVETKTNFYSKNSKSRIKSSKSLNSNNRQKFKKKLAIYKSQTNDVLNRTDRQNSPEINDNYCQQIETTECLNERTNIIVMNSNNDNNINSNSINSVENSCAQQTDNLSSHFVIKIRI